MERIGYQWQPTMCGGVTIATVRSVNVTKQERRGRGGLVCCSPSRELDNKVSVQQRQPIHETVVAAAATQARVVWQKKLCQLRKLWFWGCGRNG